MIFDINDLSNIMRSR